MQKTSQNMPEATSFEKDNKMLIQFMFARLYLLGLRILELATSTWGSFKFHQGAWWFFVKGKSGKLGHIPTNEQLLAFVKSYKNYLGKSHLPDETDTSYLILSKKLAER